MDVFILSTPGGREVDRELSNQQLFGKLRPEREVAQAHGYQAVQGTQPHREAGGVSGPRPEWAPHITISSKRVSPALVSAWSSQPCSEAGTVITPTAEKWPSRDSNPTPPEATVHGRHFCATSPLSSSQADTLSWKRLDLSGGDCERQTPRNFLLLSQRPAWLKVANQFKESPQC